jgi:hypothetical protein
MRAVSASDASKTLLQLAKASGDADDPGANSPSA